jgi:hypothetical protein
MLLIFDICNVIPLVGILKSLEENESSIPIDFGKKEGNGFCFSHKNLSSINLSQTSIVGIISCFQWMVHLSKVMAHIMQQRNGTIINCYA